MPSFQHLLVLAVLGMSMYTQAAPVLVSSGSDVQVAAPVERELATYSFADESLDARDFDAVDDNAEENEDEEDLDDDADTRDDDEGLHVRAVKKAAKVAAKPKTAAKAKTVAKPKVAAKPKIAAKPKVATKPKVAAKPKTAAKPEVVTKPKTAAKPKVAAKPATAKTTKATAKPTTTPAAGAACALKPKTKTVAKPKKAATRAYDFIADLFRRDGPEFVGWHGTNSDTAAFWAKQGQLEKPPAKTGFFDFNLFGPKTGTAPGTSGADAEIGPGVYVTDDQDIAVAFANNNAKVNAGTTAQLCAIFAKSEANWRTAIRKAFIPENLVGDSSNPVTKKAKEDARLAHIKKAVPGVSAPNVIKFSLLNRSTKTGQLVLPAGLTNQFTAKCVDASETASVAGASKFPAFSYNGATLRSEWNIAAENAGECA